MVHYVTISILLHDLIYRNSTILSSKMVVTCVVQNLGFTNASASIHSEKQRTQEHTKQEMNLILLTLLLNTSQSKLLTHTGDSSTQYLLLGGV